RSTTSWNSPTTSTDASATFLPPASRTIARAMIGSWTPVALRPLPKPASQTGLASTAGVTSTAPKPTRSAGSAAESGPTPRTINSKAGEPRAVRPRVTQPGASRPSARLLCPDRSVAIDDSLSDGLRRLLPLRDDGGVAAPLQALLQILARVLED